VCAVGKVMCPVGTVMSAVPLTVYEVPQLISCVVCVRARACACARAYVCVYRKGIC